jgi:hypothetical protein
MKTIDEIRHERLFLLLKEYPTVQALADKIERNASQVSQWKNRSKRATGTHASIDSDSARHIEQRTGKPRGWMDNDPAYDNPGSMSPGQMAGRYIDSLPTLEERLLAFWHVHQMVAGKWPPCPDSLRIAAQMTEAVDSELEHALRESGKGGAG